MSYISTIDVQTFLNVTLQAQGLDQVNALIPAIENFMETACNRTWNVTSQQVETFDGNQLLYFPKHLPIGTVQSVVVNGYTLVAGSDYYVYSTYIRLAATATDLPQSVVITYTPSEVLPDEVKHAMVRWCAQIYKESKDAGKVVSRLSMGPVTLDYLAKDGIPQFVQEVISRHRLRPV